MAQITLKTPSGADAGRVELDDATFAIQPNVAVMHQVVTAQLAHRRAGTHSTKTRSEVRGGGAKPYRQKGTGNARQGSTSSPHYSGGGIAHGPRPRSYAQRTPKKMIKLALRSALSDRASEGRVIVVDSWGFDGPKTKDARQALAALGVEGRSLVVVDRFDSPAALSFRNLPDVQIIRAGELNAYDVLCNDWIVFEQSLLPTSRLSDAPGQVTSLPAGDTQADVSDGSLEHGEPEASTEGSEATTEHEEADGSLEHGEAEPSSEAAEGGSEDEES